MGVCQKMLQRRGKENRSPDGLRFPRSYVEGHQRRCVHQPHVKVRHRGSHIYDIHFCLCLHIDCQITQSRLCLEIGPPPLEVGAPSATTHAEATGTTGRWGHAVLPIQICLRDNPVRTSTSHSPCETAQWPVSHSYPAKVTHYKYINYVSKGTGASGRIGPSAPPIVAWANLMERKWDKEVFATLLSGIRTYKFSLAANAVRQVTWDNFMTKLTCFPSDCTNLKVSLHQVSKDAEYKMNTNLSRPSNHSLLSSIILVSVCDKQNPLHKSQIFHQS